MKKEEFANLGVGETFQLGCRKFKVVENKKNKLCDKCDFKKNDFEEFCLEMNKEQFLPECCSETRKDRKHVYFVEVEDE